MPLPPRWVRRVVVGPAVVLGAVVLVTTLPLWVFGVLALASLVPRAMRTARVLWLVTFYLVWDSVALVVLFLLWVASGFGWKLRAPWCQRAHYLLAGAFLHGLFRQARWVLRLKVEVTGVNPDGALPGRPLIVASRHGGPGDSILLVHALINWYHREPRIVLKESIQWDPAVDVLLNRVPSRFIAPTAFGSAPSAEPGASAVEPGAPKAEPGAPVVGPGAPVVGPGAPSAGGPVRRGHADDTPAGVVDDRAEQVGRLATGLDANDALVIFPEGGQFTHARRQHRIARLIHDGRHAMAARAEAMRNVMAPRPGGLLAALDAAPDAGVMFVAHTGLERLNTVGAIWRELPMDKRILLHGWRVPPEEIPVGREARIEWLYTWWERIDAWIESRPDLAPA